MGASFGLLLRCCTLSVLLLVLSCFLVRFNVLLVCWLFMRDSQNSSQ